jgi:hypothetical protein
VDGKTVSQCADYILEVLGFWVPPRT